MLPTIACICVLFTCFVLAEAQTVTITTVRSGSIKPTSTPLIPRTAIAIEEVESGSASGQVNVFLSPEIQAILQSTIDNDCAIVSRVECAIILSGDLMNAQIASGSSLQGRQLESLQTGELGVTGALTYQMLPVDNVLKIANSYSFEADKLLDNPNAAAVVMNLSAATVTLSAGVSQTTTIKGITAQEYVIVPPFSPNVNDKVEDIVTRQGERLAFEIRAVSNGIVLQRVTSDNYIDLWTAFLTPPQVAFVRADILIEEVMLNVAVDIEEDIGDDAASNERLGKYRRRHHHSYEPRRERPWIDDHVLGVSHLNSSKQESGDINASLKDEVLTGMTTQSKAPFELSTLSHSAQLYADDHGNYEGDYDYISSAGENTFIYVVEKYPFVISHPDIGLTPGDVDGWIVPNRAIHATAVVSKIIGKTTGVAKKAKVVCVQMAAAKNKVDGWLNQWRMITQDAISKKRANPGKNIIINYSNSARIPLTSDYTSNRNALLKVFRCLYNADVAIVLSGGNDPKLQKPSNVNDIISTEQYVANTHRDLSIIMAGAAKQNGESRINPDIFSNVWAVGENDLVADPTNGGFIKKDGSSLAAPQISALLAMLYEDSKLTDYWRHSVFRPKDALNLLKVTSKKRENSGASAVKLAYNLAQDKTCGAVPYQKVRRIVVHGPQSCMVLNPSLSMISYSTIPGTIPTSTTVAPLPVITSGSNGGTCGNSERIGPVGINSKPIDKNTLQKCLLDFDTKTWHDKASGPTVDCGGMVSFQSSSTSWDSPADCHNACKNCLSESIDEGVNQIRCDAWHGSAHCWEGYIITPPPLVTDGTPFYGNIRDHPTEQVVVASGYQGIKWRYLDMYAIQDCIRHFDGSKWYRGDSAYNCGGMLHFDMYSDDGWNSPSDCWNAIKNCVSDAVNKGASEAYCVTSAGFLSCRGGFYPR